MSVSRWQDTSPAGHCHLTLLAPALEDSPLCPFDKPPSEDAATLNRTRKTTPLVRDIKWNIVASDKAPNSGLTTLVAVD